MAARRTRKPGPDQGGRDARRSPRAERRTQNQAGGRRASGSGADRERRAPASKPSGEGTDRDRSVRVIGRKRAADGGPRSDHTIFGLSTARAVILAVVVCMLALTLAVPLRTYFTQRSDASSIEAERVKLENDIAELQLKKQQQDDPAYVAAEARDRLRLVMPGETPYQVQLPGAYEAAQAERAKPEPTSGTWYSDLWDSVSEPRPVGPVPAPVAPPPAPAAPPAPGGPGG
ncbi:septum formation initiator family protein [Aldersonia sp. NBC_00410]|uniref:FtsB family cell division protein n=1 Tax=Aldersonia sp. NBC_00410 TaxID=2975954 RepID=UPI0022527586|nr:septum formation initiator family protein [Aldersonia sp. NBC_00410]MCX5045503.1 septum formation initiator family protein [Aldersonia sp. NBC_00410]